MGSMVPEGLNEDIYKIIKEGPGTGFSKEKVLSLIKADYDGKYTGIEPWHVARVLTTLRITQDIKIIKEDGKEDRYIHNPDKTEISVFPV